MWMDVGWGSSKPQPFATATVVEMERSVATSANSSASILPAAGPPISATITPPGGTTLDPFAGSGTTGAAAFLEGFSAVLIEREAEYQADIERRIGALEEQPVAAPDLFACA
jgi:hypothetical protein